MKLSAKAQRSINKMIEKFQSGDISPLTEAAQFQLPDDAPANKWTYSNRVLGFAQTGSLDNRGFNQWKEADRHVKKGSVAGYIFIPKLKKETDDNGEESRKLIGFRTIPVFGSFDTEGEGELPDYTPVQLPPLMEVAAHFGIDVQYLPMEGALGDCSHTGKTIRLATSSDKVFFHELAHAIHAKIDGNLKGGQNPAQETIAEFTAAVLADIYNVGDFSGNAWSYISHYNENPIRAITKCLDKIGQVVDLILQTQETIGAS